MRVLLVPILLVLLVPLGACTEVSERIVLDDKGGGTYALILRWNADLWRRVGEHVPKQGREKLEAHPFPMTADVWRDGLDGLEGVTVALLEERDAGDGWRELAVELGFRSLPELFRWEVLARRSAKLTVEQPGDDEDADRFARLEMEPLTFVPVLDPLAGLLDATQDPPPKAEGLRAHRDPPPLRRFGLDAGPAAELWKWVAPEVSKARLTFSVTVSGTMREIGPKHVSERTDTARFEFDFDALRDAETDRTLSMRWRVPSVDDVPAPFEHAGETRAAVAAGIDR